MQNQSAIANSKKKKKKNHFPDWLFSALVIIIGGMMIIYFEILGGPFALSANKQSAARLKALFDEQSNLKVIKNNSQDDYRLDYAEIIYFDSSTTMQQYKYVFSDYIISKGASIPVEIRTPWAGRCFYVLLVYWKLDAYSEVETKFLPVNLNSADSDGVIIINN